MRLPSFPFAAPFLVTALLLLVVLIVLIEISATEYGYARVGVGHRAMPLILLFTLPGNQHPTLAHRAIEMTGGQEALAFGVRWVVPVVERRNRTVIAVNIGGAVLPVLLSGIFVTGILAVLLA